jgi:coiled-coil domain-containing protein 15
VNVLCGTDVDRAPTVPVLRPGVETREERVRASQQLAMYRRLFMDIEREQIRENIRQRNHRMKMAS